MNGNSDISFNGHTEDDLQDRRQLLARWPHLLAPLPSEDAIIGHWTEAGPPVVTIICSTFNQSKLVGAALQGFLTQKTSFPFEVVVRDDASTDGTQKVVEDFIRRYPLIIRAAFNEKNRYRQGIAPVHDRPGLIRGEYTALCDGDDFWVEPHKLQQQVDQLRRDPDVVLSTGGAMVYRVSDSSISVEGEVDDEVRYDDLPNRYHHTSTYVFRSKPYINVIQNWLVPSGLHGDTPTRSCIVLHGKIAAIPGVLSVYYADGRGVWSRHDTLRQAEMTVEMHAKLVRILPWRRRIREFRHLGDASRCLVRLRFSSDEKTGDGYFLRTIARLRRVLVRHSFELLVMATAIYRAGQRFDR